MNDNDHRPYAPIQVLAVACTAIGEPGAPQCAWLHGYALLTVQPTNSDVQLTGTVVTGERYARDDRKLIASLEATLDPRAVLAGLDLTTIIGRLDRLPIDVEDQGPSLALLDKIEAMVVNQAPIDLTLDADTKLSLFMSATTHDLLLPKEYSDEGEVMGVQLFGCPDNANTAHLAVVLADMVGVAALAIGEHFLEPDLNRSLIDGWERWRRNLHAGWQFEANVIEIEPIA